jgi:hypothetical protein
MFIFKSEKGIIYSGAFCRTMPLKLSECKGAVYFLSRRGHVVRGDYTLFTDSHSVCADLNLKFASAHSFHCHLSCQPGSMRKPLSTLTPFVTDTLFL